MTLPLIEHLVSPEIHRRFEIYERLLREWNSRTNLVQQDTLGSFMIRHILDSLQILPLIDEAFRASLISHQGNLLSAMKLDSPYDQTMFNNSSNTILDIGSGAGFPGMVLAICGYKNVTLCESNHKKCVFLDEVARQTGTDIIVLNQRVEDISCTYDVFVSRAMTDFVSLCSIMATHMASEASIGIFHKGRRWKEEVDQAQDSWSYESQAFPSVTSSDSVILFLSDLKSK
ncbi:MAG: 16S rRNA (guanine(527)-N(7))-methyltransferase RsmG [Alphaproteobacteria bacterium]|jgi:16S rRNA (guanine527-N7)-methyltransferase|nr:16S rRNA (guanine(527)-N(7))-methyltransferase RsmG [Alphaproteobacteria bacterium]